MSEPIKRGRGRPRKDGTIKVNTPDPETQAAEELQDFIREELTKEVNTTPSTPVIQPKTSIHIPSNPTTDHLVKDIPERSTVQAETKRKDSISWSEVRQRLGVR